jgi:hypothetical protein
VPKVEESAFSANQFLFKIMVPTAHTLTLAHFKLTSNFRHYEVTAMTGMDRSSFNWPKGPGFLWLNKQPFVYGNQT